MRRITYEFFKVKSRGGERAMECALATFSRKEVEDLLREEGFTPGTHEFRAVLSRRFRPSEDVPGKFIERDWKREPHNGSSKIDRFDSEAYMRSRSECVGNLPGQDAPRLLGRGYKSLLA